MNSIFTTPLASESRCGKKKAVSFRFLRAETLLRSGCSSWRRVTTPFAHYWLSAIPPWALVIGAGDGAASRAGGHAGAPGGISDAAALERAVASGHAAACPSHAALK